MSYPCFWFSKFPWSLDFWNIFIVALKPLWFNNILKYLEAIKYVSRTLKRNLFSYFFVQKDVFPYPRIISKHWIMVVKAYFQVSLFLE